MATPSGTGEASPSSGCRPRTPVRRPRSGATAPGSNASAASRSPPTRSCSAGRSSDLDAFWQSIWDFFEVRSHAPHSAVLADGRHAGRRAGSRARRLNFAEHLLGRDEDADNVAIVAYSQTRDRRRADVRRAARAGGARPRGPRAARRAAGRPRRRLPAEHPRDADRVRRRDEPRRDLGELRARARRPQRDRPPLAARPGDPADRRRLRLPRQDDRPPRRGRGDPRGAARPAPRRARALRRARATGRRRLGGAAVAGRAARIPAGRLRAPALGALLVRHDRHPEGDRARPRRHPPGVPQGARAELGSEARRPPAVVLDDVLDDVDGARLGAPHALLDRHDRRRPGLARPRLAVADRRGDAADVHGRQPRLPDGLPQGGPAARARLRPDLDPRLRHRGLAARPSRATATSTSSSAPTSCSSTAAAAPTSAAASSAAARCCRSTRARSRAACSASRPRPSTPPAGRSSASSASS